MQILVVNSKKTTLTLLNLMSLK